MPPLTAHLYSLHKPHYIKATQHPFLSDAANGVLPPARLALWLSQDRSYAAHAYPRLIGRIISSIPFSSTHSKILAEEKQNRKVLDMCVYALKNVADEVEYFDREAERFGLDTDGWKVRKGTRDYMAEMARVGVEGTLLDGLVYVWAMEQCYLDAWRYVASNVKTSSGDGAAIASFAEHWTNAEFVKFVDGLAELVDSLDVKQGSEQWTRAEAIWARVIELEEDFWPNEGEEATMKA